MDEMIGYVISSLESNNMLSNSIIIFASDNGGHPVNSDGNNLPLRGGKNTFFEGGLRVPAMIYSELFDSSYVNRVEDWLVSNWIRNWISMIHAASSTVLVGSDFWKLGTDDYGMCI